MFAGMPHARLHGRLSPEKLSREKLLPKNCRLYYFGKKMSPQKLLLCQIVAMANCRPP
jgi:hypothetical protein